MPKNVKELTKGTASNTAGQKKAMFFCPVMKTADALICICCYSAETSLAGYGCALGEGQSSSWRGVKDHGNDGAKGQARPGEGRWGGGGGRGSACSLASRSWLSAYLWS